MKTIVIPFFAIAFLSLTLQGCKKYEENEGILSLRTVNSRLTNGDWGLTKLTIGGVDSTFEYKEIDFRIFFIKAKDPFEEGIHTYTLEYTRLGTLETISGRVNFTNNGDLMTFTREYYNFFGSPSNSASLIFDTNNSLEWSVDKLTNKEMILRSSRSGVKYEWILFKI